MLKPLEQFFCDKCGGIIEKPEHGWVEWESKIEGNSLKQWGFKIVHHSSFSPIMDKQKRDGGCYHYQNSLHRSDLHLDCFLGNYSMPELLSFLDIGPYHNPVYDGPNVFNMREFVEFARRLTIPFYEEARKYWSIALADGYFADANEIWIYLPENLKQLIEKYSDK